MNCMKRQRKQPIDEKPVLADDEWDDFPPPKRFPSRLLLAGVALLSVFAALLATETLWDGRLAAGLLYCIGGAFALGGGVCLYIGIVQAVRFAWGQVRKASQAK